MTELFVDKTISGEVININDIKEPDIRAIIMDLALRAVYSVFHKEQIKQNIKGKGTISIIRGTVIFTVVDTYQVGVHIDGKRKIVCVKGKDDAQWKEIASDVMDEAPHYKKCEECARLSERKSHLDLEVGDFVFGTNEGSKESGIIDYLRWFMKDNLHETFNVPCICCVERIEDLTEDELNNYDFMSKKPKDFNGGSYSEDVPDSFNGYDWSGLTYAQKRSWIQRVCILRTPTRWVAVDPQGYDYCRYVHFPIKWRDMYAKDIEKAEQKEREYQAYLQAEEDKRNAAKQERYDERVKRIMKATHNLKGFKAIEWDKKGAQIRCNNVVKEILKAFYPDVKFSVLKGYEWHSIQVSWSNGPDKYEVQNIIETLSGDEWITDECDYSNYGERVTEFRENRITKRLGQVGHIGLYHHKI